MLATTPIELLYQLEPLAGAAFAINLGYLALDRFRYQRTIEAAARRVVTETIANIEGLGDLGRHLMRMLHSGELDAVRHLRWLARESRNASDRPGGTPIAFYAYVFQPHTDVGISLALVTSAVMSLASGVAVNLGRWSTLAWLGLEPQIGWLFYLNITGIIVPPAMIVLGRTCTKASTEQALHCREQLASMITLSISDITSPPRRRAPEEIG